MRITIRIPSVSDLRRKVEEKLKETTQVVYDWIIHFTSATRPTWTELMRLHPYSRRNPVEPYASSPYVVRRTGRLQRCIEQRRLGDWRYGIIFKTSSAPYITYVQKGTVRMVPRDFVRAAIEKVRPQIEEIWKRP